MAKTRLILVTALAVVILAYLGLLVSGRGIKARITDGFTSLSPKTNTFTLYYMNGCPHCETILPEYKRFAASGQLTSNGSATEIRMLEQSNPAAAAELEANNVKGFPTFIMTTSSGKTLEYSGDRTVAAMKEFIKANAS